MITSILVIVAIVVLLGLLLWLINIIATNMWQAARIPEGDYAFVVKGESLVKLITNFPNTLNNNKRMIWARFTGKGERGSDFNARFTGYTEGPLSALLRDLFGIFWISIFFPMIKLHRFKISVDRLKEAAEIDTTANLKDWIEYKEDEVDSLRRIFNRPTHVPEAEMTDGSKINFVLLGDYEVIDPYPPVFLYKGKYSRIIDAAVRAAVNDWCSYRAYRHDAVGPDNSPRKALVNDAVGEDTETSKFLTNEVNKALAITGIVCRKIYIYGYDLWAEGKTFDDAAREKEVATLRAEGIVAAAEGDAKAIELKAGAQAKRYGQIVSSLSVPGANPDVIAQTVLEILKAEQRATMTNLTTLVEGQGAGIVIPTKDGNS